MTYKRAPFANCPCPTPPLPMPLIKPNLSDLLSSHPSLATHSPRMLGRPAPGQSVSKFLISHPDEMHKWRAAASVHMDVTSRHDSCHETNICCARSVANYVDIPSLGVISPFYYKKNVKNASDVQHGCRRFDWMDICTSGHLHSVTFRGQTLVLSVPQRVLFFFKKSPHFHTRFVNKVH